MASVSVVDWCPMNFILKPWQLFFLILSGWINRQQREIIEFQNAQIQALLDKMGRKQILLTDDQRRVLAVKGKALGRKAMMELTTIVTPDTILRWHRRLIGEKRNYSAHRENAPSRPPVPDEVTRLILRIAKENPTWGYDPIQGRSPTLETGSPTQPSGTFSKQTASSRHRTESIKPHGRLSSRPTGMFSGRLTSPPSRSGRSMVW